MRAFFSASFTALFVTVNQVNGAAFFAVLSRDASRAEQRRAASRPRSSPPAC